jgi:hypothetical protein
LTLGRRVAMQATIDQELLEQLRDRAAHSVVFAEAAERSAKELFEVVREIVADREGGGEDE